MPFPSALRSSLRVAVGALALTAGAPRAWALQPLVDFVRAARTHNPSNQEAAANRRAAAAQASEALGRALPGVAASVAYTRNQREVAFAGLTLLPKDQHDASFTLTVPLVDLSRFAGIAAAWQAAEAARQGEAATALQTEAQVVQGYYQLVADLALVDAARKALDVVNVNVQVTEEALKAGTGTTLDVERARAEVERQSQQLTSAELAVKLAARSLETLTGVRADLSSSAALADDLHAERPLGEFSAAATPSVLAAVAGRRAAERNALAQDLALIPSVAASGNERLTNATGFLGGYHDAWAVMISAVWSFDFSTVSAVRARSAEAAAARAREESARLAAGDAVYQLWSTVEANRARSRSARAQEAVSAHAAEIARTRYRSGVATQLELIQADRDAFAAEATRIQSDADLLNARLQLRLAAGQEPLTGGRATTAD